MKELKERYKKSLNAKTSSIEQSKTEISEKREDKRFKLVSIKREIKLNELEDWPDSGVQTPQVEKNETSNNLFHIYDLVSEDIDKDVESEGRTVPAGQEKISCNGVEMIREYVSAPVSADKSDSAYVYDLYYTGDDPEDLTDFDDSLLDGLVSIQPFNSGEDLWYDATRSDEFKYDDDIDSNDEDNDRNEYPDEDDEDCSYLGYGDDDFDLDMRVKGLALGGSEDERGDLSSDEEDQLLYTRTFKKDSENHGAAYARFKHKMMREFYGANQDGDSEDDDYEGFVDEDF